LFEKRKHIFGRPRAASLEIGDTAIDCSRDLVLVANEVTQGIVCQRAQWTAGAFRQLAQLFMHIIVELHGFGGGSHDDNVAGIGAPRIAAYGQLRSLRSQSPAFATTPLLKL
jgi:hypothetical protein